MKRIVGLAVLVLAVVVCASSVQVTSSDAPVTSPPTREVVRVPAGASLEIELQGALSTRTTRKGDLAQFMTVSDLQVLGRIAIPRGSKVRAMVVESKRSRQLYHVAEMRFKFKELILPDGTSLPFEAVLTRAGDGPPGTQTVQLRKANGPFGAATEAPAIPVGGAGSSRRSRSPDPGCRANCTVLSAVAVTITVTIAAVYVMRHGLDLSFSPGTKFEVMLADSLSVPVRANQETKEAVKSSPSAAPSQPYAPVSQAESGASARTRPAHATASAPAAVPEGQLEQGTVPLATDPASSTRAQRTPLAVLPLQAMPGPDPTVGLTQTMVGETTAFGAPELPPSPPITLEVPAGGDIEIELRNSLNTRTTQKGDDALFSTTNDLWTNGRVAVPRGSTVRATVAESKRSGRVHGRAEMQFEFKELVLPDGSSVPLAADLSRAGQGPPGTQIVKGEHGKAHDVTMIARAAGLGAIWAGIMSQSLRGAGIAGAEGAALAGVVMMARRGPDVDLPPGMRFQVVLTKRLKVPDHTADGPVMAANLVPLPLSAIPGSMFPSREIDTMYPSAPADTPTAPGVPRSGGQAAQISGNVAANRSVPQQAPSVQPAPPAASTLARALAGGYTVKVNVNLVLVDATVRDQHGGIVEGLTLNDFRIFEDGSEQHILGFSRDELPLAVALVVDRSGSVAPAMGQIHDAALRTLSQLKPEDEVALFTFASEVGRVEPLTADRNRIADAISRLQASGGTNITDALDEAAVYLGQAGRGRRHAIILISDNQGTVRGYASDSQAIRSALESETVIYSIRVRGADQVPLPLLMQVWVPSIGSVKKMTRETGGEIIDTRQTGSIEAAMREVIRRLKMRYTLSYESSDQRHDGGFRKIRVQIADRPDESGTKYTVYARPGYYAPLDHMAAQNP